MIDSKGQVTPAMRVNIERLLLRVHSLLQQYIADR